LGQLLATHLGRRAIAGLQRLLELSQLLAAAGTNSDRDVDLATWVDIARPAGLRNRRALAARHRHATTRVRHDSPPCSASHYRSGRRKLALTTRLLPHSQEPSQAFTQIFQPVCFGSVR